MTKSKFLHLIFFSSLILAVYNVISIKLHLFWISPVLDSPSHALGGFVSALIIAYFTREILQNKTGMYQSFFLFFGVFIIGILWEIFEVKYNMSFPLKRGYWPDTVSDIVFDLFGGFLAYTYAIKSFYGRK